MSERAPRWAWVLVVMCGCQPAQKESVVMVEPSVAAAVAQQKVLFGHQSVGANILDGVRDLDASWRVEPLRADAVATAPGLYHFFAGQNEDPDSKLRDFEATVERTHGEFDVALLKFCYVDIDENTDVDALFSRTVAMFDRLSAKYPKVRFVAVTTPLTVVQEGPKKWLKRLMGKPAWGVRENVKRHAFNQKLREVFTGPRLFDLAALEATRADGTLDTFDVDGMAVPRLRADFSADGGHLNALGRRSAAAKLMQVLSSK